MKIGGPSGACLAGRKTPVAAPSIAHVPLMKMGPHDDPEAFVHLFEKTAEACGWARTQWPVRLIPLLTGEAQVAAQQLPVANLLAYEDLKRVIMQRVGRNPEQHQSTLPLRGARGLRLTVCDGSAAPGRMPQVAHGRAMRRRGSDRSGGAGVVRRTATQSNGRVGPVPPPDVAGAGHPAGGGPSGGVPRGRRAPD